MNPYCECKLSGFCKRHQMYKSNSEWERCKGIANSDDCGLKYWICWESGACGAKIPNDPILNPDPFCNGKSQIKSANIKSTIGSELHKIILREEKIVIPCNDCKQEINNLNTMSPDEVEEIKDELIDRMINRINKLNIPLWKKIAVAADEKIGIGIARQKILKWIDEAISNERNRLEIIKNNTNNGKGIWAVNKDIKFITSSQLQDDIKKLISKLPQDITAIAGVARSGLAVATMLAMYLHLPMFTIRQTMGDIQETGNGWRLGGSKHIDPQKSKVLIVDDTVMTGNSQRAIEHLLKKNFKDYITAAIYVNPNATKKPDIWVHDLPWPHLLEWNLFNSILSPNMAIDFDGILCQNCSKEQDDDGEKYLNFIRNASPLYLPRKNIIPLIITARVEKYREETMKWLERHNVKVNKLIMHPAKTTREREMDDVVMYKSTNYNRWAATHKASPPPSLFIESEDWQARGIAKITRKIVVCPSSAKVYQ